MYYIKTHKFERSQYQDLFKINEKTHKEELENLLVILSDESAVNRALLANLPSNQEVMKYLNTMNTSKKPNDLQINKLYVICWLQEDGSYQWYLGYAKEKIKGDKYIIDHLCREISASN